MLLASFGVLSLMLAGCSTTEVDTEEDGEVVEEEGEVVEEDTTSAEEE